MRYIEGKWLIHLAQLYRRKELCHQYGIILDSVLTTKEELSMMEWQFIANVTLMFMQAVWNTLNPLSDLRTHHPSLQTQKAKAKENKKSSNISSSSANQGSIPELFTKAQKYERTMRRW